jgi:outer membrane protein insertion porin family
MRLLSKICLFFGLISLAFSAHAASFVVKDVRIQGLQGISNETVMSYMPVQVGQRFDSSQSGQVIHALYDTGFFSDVSLATQGGVLIVTVVERPVIASLDVSGNKTIPKDKLNDVIKKLGLAQGQVFDSSILDRVKHSLESEYDTIGKYNARITTTATPEPRNRVAVKLNISEGRTAQVQQIHIIGNHVFSSSKLIGEMTLTTPRIWSIVTQGDLYSQDKLNSSLEAISSYYLNRGYLKFKVDSAQATLTPDRNYIYITIHVTEGPVYTFKGYRIISNVEFDQATLKKLIEIQPGANFSREAVRRGGEGINKLLGNMGYAFANVDPVPDVDEKTKQVFITYYVDPGHRVYVRRINFSGNTKTEDVVLRRTMPQMEGGLVSTDDIKESKRQLDLLGYLENVNVQTVAVPDVPDQVDLNYSLTEGPSAQATVGVGYGTDGIQLDAGVNQSNFMGTGKTVGINASHNRYQTTYSFNYNNPYYTQDGVQRGFTVYASRITPGNLNVTSYTSNQYGASVNYSIPMSASGDSMQLGYGYQITTLSLGSTPSTQLQNFVGGKGTRFNQLLLTGGWTHNGLDKAFMPTRGLFDSLGALVSLPGGGKRALDYYKLTYQLNYYHPLVSNFIFTARTNLGYGNGFASTHGLPFFANYYAGGPEGTQGQVRGYRTNTMGPKDSNGDPMGGNVLTTGTLGIIFPNPFQADKLRTSVFLDGGNVYTTLPRSLGGGSRPIGGGAAGPVRYSAGLGVDWQVPVMNFVLNLSLARAINPQRQDSLDFFQFNLGTNF